MAMMMAVVLVFWTECDPTHICNGGYLVVVEEREAKGVEQGGDTEMLRLGCRQVVVVRCDPWRAFMTTNLSGLRV